MDDGGCYGDCPRVIAKEAFAGLAGELQELREENQRMLAMLKQLEWFYEGPNDAWCLCCFHYRDRTGHAEDCKMKRLLEENK